MEEEESKEEEEEEEEVDYDESDAEEEESQEVEEEVEVEEDDEVECEEIVHNGVSLLKVANDEESGCFNLLVKDSSEGAGEDEYDIWGTMDSEGAITEC